MIKGIALQHQHYRLAGLVHQLPLDLISSLVTRFDSDISFLIFTHPSPVVHSGKIVARMTRNGYDGEHGR